MDKIDLNIEDIKLNLSKEIFNSNDGADKYNKEYKTNNCINDVFSNIQKILDEYQDSKNIFTNYLDQLVEISEEASKRALHFIESIKSNKYGDIIQQINEDVMAGGTNHESKSSFKKAVALERLNTLNSQQLELEAQKNKYLENGLSEEELPLHLVRDIELNQILIDNLNEYMGINDPLKTKSVNNNIGNTNKAIVNTNSGILHVRQKKGYDEKIIADIPNGTSVTILERYPDSEYVKVALDNGAEGYVSSKWLSEDANTDIIEEL